MTEKFTARMADEQVRRDTRTLGDFVGIYCAANHAERERAPIESDAASLGVYGRTTPVVCAECAEHLRYAEKRRAYCPKDPKPFCAHCDTHCYKPEERVWQRQMMRYSGPRSVFHGHAIDGIKHALEGRSYRKRAGASGSRKES
ncbi:MAG: nitrous oxide-stimulated promoter family protein [Actinomycetia bacterium]|nr:nitrous oxide-stimulated promoter family protein [Actinomycetes bacterium]